REEAIGRVENSDVAARGEHAIVLIHDLPAAAHGQMLHYSEDEHDVEAPVEIGEPPRLLVGQELHVAHATEPHLLDLHPHHGREGGARLEGTDLPPQGLLGEVLRDVAERAADLEHAEIPGAAAPQIGEEGVEEMVSPRRLVDEVLGSAHGALALDEHLDEPGAVRRRVVASAHAEHAAIAQVFEAVRRLAHRLEDSSAPARLPTPASPEQRRCGGPASAAGAPSPAPPPA